MMAHTPAQWREIAIRFEQAPGHSYMLRVAADIKADLLVCLRESRLPDDPLYLALLRAGNALDAFVLRWGVTPPGNIAEEVRDCSTG